MRLPAAVLLIALALTSCARTPSVSPAPATITPAAATSASASPAITPPPIASMSAARVTRIVDGETVDITIDGRPFRLRYIGIDAPETSDPRNPVECLGKEASEHNRRLAEGKTVLLEKDISETDQFGRLLRYVWSDGRMVNASLVEDGYAQASVYPPDVKYAGLLAGLEEEAREAGRGLWGTACQATPSPTAATGTCEYSDGARPLVKGNISSSGEKIYHTPGGEFYQQTIIDEPRGERWFCREADALAAGWRKSLR